MTDHSGPEIITFGCRLNAYESEVMRDNAIAAGLEDVVIVNSCAVTAEAPPRRGDAAGAAGDPPGQKGAA
ncbi:threonylcarbamoyladenosine tRNA methylthiotransferase MtaB [alpha proteobacterium Q-1]|nr:threonylcarbamoyladenosine tRNA methylthiotransferase MtaB [alpha proteobacterium Q-1]